MNKFKLCIISSGILPIPDVKGGAVERLMTMIAEDNEQRKLMRLTILTCSDDEAILAQKKFKCTKFINFSKTNNKIILKYGEKIRWHLLYQFGYDFNIYDKYIHAVNQYLLKHGGEFDLIINEGAKHDAFRPIAKKWGRDKLCEHLHFNCNANCIYEQIYGSVVAVSDFIINKYRQNSRLTIDRTRTIFNGIDTSLFENILTENEKLLIRKKLGFSINDYVIIFCGRIIPEKGIRELIKAVLKLNNPNIKILIIGSINFGVEDTSLYLNEIKSLSIKYDNIIKFTGYIKNNEIYKYHQIANLGVVPSIYNDPCPLALFELITSGLPTIATKAGGMVEIGTSDTTLFIPLDNNFIESLSSAILQIYSNPVLQKKMGMSAKERSKEFTRDRFYNDFYKNLVELSIKDNK